MRLPAFLTLLIVNVAIGASASANTYSMGKNTGQDLLNGWYWSVTESCRPKWMAIEIVSAPFHGAVRVEACNVNIDREARVGEVGNCLGHSIPGKCVRYRPDPGYSGPDRFAIRYSNENGTLYDTYTIEAGEQPKAPTASALSILEQPLTAGSATPALLSGSPEYEKKRAAFEAHKADVFRRLNEVSKLRNDCRDKLPSCSTTGTAYDPREAERRRDSQYLTWGEASYYIPWSNVLTDVPPGLERDIGTWGGIKVFGYGGDKLWIWLKGNVVNFGSTPAGAGGLADKGWKKAHDDNDGFQP